MSLNLKDLPEVTFVETDANKILNDMISGYEAAYFQQTGKIKKLYPGDPIRIFLYSQALRELQLRVILNDTAKQNLLKYARGEVLQNLGAFFRTDKLAAESARVLMKFNLSAARPTNEIIPSGTRVSPGNEIYFTVIEDTVIPAGVTFVEVLTQCVQTGTIGNDFTPGQINILVDPLPYNATVENIETSSGGIEAENDDNYRNRIHLAPEGFSTAGPEGAYEYFVRQFSPLISDVKIFSPSDGVVDIRVLLQNGEIPNQTLLDGLLSYMSDKSRRPLTDKVQVGAPEIIQYDLDVVYYLRSSDISVEQDMRARVEHSVDEYTMWQRSKIGRDINPSELTAKTILAGAKRIEISSPNHTVLSDIQVAVVNIKSVSFGGFEDE
ncbi:baseplate J/gp47 family protein [Ureibacillus chungkukjangi]|uniref:baseplate assembly protein n=1 Tax=Ureibacillus chungkukjangi TaxID=1202712 RepID=UPI00384C5F7F